MIATRELDKKYFSSINMMVNTPSYNMSKYKPVDVIMVDNTLSFSVNSSVRSLVQSDGFCVIQFSEPCLNYQTQYEKLLSSFFGAPLRVGSSDGQPYAKVQATENAKFYVNSNVAQPVHTDEGHATLFPRYAALYCATEASEGGDSIIVSFKHLYSDLVKNYGGDVDLLFANDAITVENYQGMKQKPVLIKLNNGDIGISYSPVLQKMRCSERVFEMFDYIAKYIHNAENQIRFKLKSEQVLLFDNCRVLHGRTSFAMNDPRLLYRYWFEQCSL